MEIHLEIPYSYHQDSQLFNYLFIYFYVEHSFTHLMILIWEMLGNITNTRSNTCYLVLCHAPLYFCFVSCIQINRTLENKPAELWSVREEGCYWYNIWQHRGRNWCTLNKYILFFPWLKIWSTKKEYLNDLGPAKTRVP